MVGYFTAHIRILSPVNQSKLRNCNIPWLGLYIALLSEVSRRSVVQHQTGIGKVIMYGLEGTWNLFSSYLSH